MNADNWYKDYKFLMNFVLKMNDKNLTTFLLAMGLFETHLVRARSNER